MHSALRASFQFGNFEYQQQPAQIRTARHKTSFGASEKKVACCVRASAVKEDEFTLLRAIKFPAGDELIFARRHDETMK
jgi:hypothetical protein